MVALRVSEKQYNSVEMSIIIGDLLLPTLFNISYVYIQLKLQKQWCMKECINTSEIINDNSQKSVRREHRENYFPIMFVNKKNNYDNECKNCCRCGQTFVLYESCPMSYCKNHTTKDHSETTIVDYSEYSGGW